MKLALVNGERCEAEKGLIGVCIGCEQPMVPKCGPTKVKHWAHKSRCECDRWWENETEWHRNWKNYFPKECQEIRHKDEVSGEWHIADVKTKQGDIIEFQHSFLKSEERQSRNKFYGNNLVWVVDGIKRQKDKSQFDMFLKYSRPIDQSSQLLRLHPFLEECSILNEWSNCNCPVFFDFGSGLPLWCLMPKISKDNRYILQYSRQNFIALLNASEGGQNLSGLIKIISEVVSNYENPHLQINQQQPVLSLRNRVVQRRTVNPMNLTRRELYYLNRMHPGRRGRL